MDKAQSVIDYYRSLMEYHHQDVWDIMDLHNRFAYANKNLNRIVGLPENYDFEGRYMAEPPAACYEVCSGEFIEQNEHCIRSGKEVEILDIHPGENGDWFIYIFHKRPVWVNGEIVGTLHRGRDVMEHWKEGVSGLQQLYAYFSGKKELSLSRQHPKTLTNKQVEVVFLLLCDKSIKEISQILCTSERAIRSRVDELKVKLGVSRTRDIVDAAVARGYHKHIPGRLTGKQLSMILR